MLSRTELSFKIYFIYKLIVLNDPFAFVILVLSAIRTSMYLFSNSRSKM